MKCARVRVYSSLGDLWLQATVYRQERKSRTVILRVD
jgi:hypothetical protein